MPTARRRPFRITRASIAMGKATEGWLKTEEVLAIPELLEAILLQLDDGTSAGIRTLLDCQRVNKYFQATLKGIFFQRALYFKPWNNISHPNGNLLLTPSISLTTPDSALSPAYRHNFEIFFHTQADEFAIWQRVISFNFATEQEPVHAIGSWRKMYMHAADFRIRLVQVVWGLPGQRFRRIIQCDRTGVTTGALLDLALGGRKEESLYDTTGLEQAARKEIQWLSETSETHE